MRKRLISIGIAVLIALVSFIPISQYSVEDWSVKLNQVQAAGNVTALGVIADKAGTSPWTALSSLSVTAGDRIIVAHAGDADASAVTLSWDDLFPVENLGSGFSGSLYGVIWKNQSITTTGGFTLIAVDVNLGSVTGSPTGNLTVDIYAEDGSDQPTGGVLTTGTITSYTASAYNRITVTPYALSATTKYCFVVSAPDWDLSNYYPIIGSGSSAYAGGKYSNSTDSGGTWGTPSETTDLRFHMVQYSAGTVSLNRDVVATNAGNAVASIWSGVALYTITDYSIIVTNTSTAKGIAAYAVSGLDASPLDKAPSNTGSGTDASTSTTGTLSQADEVVIAVSAVEDETDDGHGTWSDITGNEQFAATNGGGDASNMQVHSVAMIVSATTALNGVDASHDSTDWAAAAATYTISAADPDISNTPSSYDYGVVAESATPSTGLDYFTITNNSGFTVDITVGATDMTGTGTTWTLSDTATPGTNVYGMKAGLEGGSYNIIIKKTPTYNTLKASLADNATQKWGVQIFIPTSYADEPDEHTSTITVTAVAS